MNSMSLADTMLAIRRFVARRGLPSVIYSDNAKSFIAAQGNMICQYGHRSSRWKYIAPRSPWWGGWWERLVKSVKTSLRKCLGASSLGNEIDAEVPLTPAHFMGCQPVGVQLPPAKEHTSDLAVRRKLRNELLDYFWDMWSTDYIRNLPVCRGATARGQLTEGSMVLVRDDGHSRLPWPVGVVTKTFSGRDGVIRTVQVRTAKETYTRSIQLLHNLELSDAQQYVTRSGRSVRPVQQLDL